MGMRDTTTTDVKIEEIEKKTERRRAGSVGRDDVVINQTEGYIMMGGRGRERSLYRIAGGIIRTRA